MPPRRLLLRQYSSTLLIPRANVLRARTFHSSRPHHFEFSNVIELSHQIFQNIHTFTGLSWAASIPLTAALFRLSFVPVQYYSLRLLRKHQFLRPLRTAQAKILQRILDHLRPDGSRAHDEKAAMWLAREGYRRRVTRLERYNMSSHWWPTLLPLSFLPIWLVNAGVVAAMSGGNTRNILDMLDVDNSSLPPPEPGFETEGLLWIPQLNEIDPAYILPISLGMVLFIGLRASASRQHIDRDLQLIRATFAPTAPQRVVAVFWASLGEVMNTMPFLIPLAISGASSAVCLFALGSAASQVVLTPITKVLAGARAPIRPLIPQVSALKHKYRDKLSMDIWRPPSQRRGATVHLTPQAQAQEPKGSQSSPIVARPSGPQNIDSGHHMRR